MKSKAFVSVQLTYHISFSNRSIDCKLSELIETVSHHFLPAYRERRTGGGGMWRSSRANTISESLFRICLLLSISECFSLLVQEFLQPCQNYIINYGTPMNIVFGTISLKNNLVDTFSAEGNFLCGWHPSLLPCLWRFINLYL